jgi:hypothetical protein
MLFAGAACFLPSLSSNRLLCVRVEFGSVCSLCVIGSINLISFNVFRCSCVPCICLCVDLFLCRRVNRLNIRPRVLEVLSCFGRFFSLFVLQECV